MAYATKNDILTFASKAWNTTFSGTALNAAISACLGDLNGSDFLMRGAGYNGEVTLRANQNIFEVPNYKSMVSFVLTEPHPGETLPRPKRLAILHEAPGGIGTWAAARVQSVERGMPEWYIEEPGLQRLRVYPIPAVAYGVLIYYWATHPLEPDAIVYDVQFQHLLNLGTVYWEAVLRRNQEYINHWGPLYYAERQAMENKMAPIERSINP